jgi:hypothetical protein
MEVITENPIIYINSLDSEDADTFLYLDAKSTTNEIKDFQKYVNTWQGGKLKTNGKWDEDTVLAFNKYGKDYEEFINPTSRINKTYVKTEKIEPVNIRAKEPSAIEKENAKKKGLTWDSAKKVYVQAQELGIVDALLGKLGITPRTTTPPVGVDAPLGTSGSSPIEESKGMSTTTKILIGVGALAVVGFVIYSSTSGKTNKGK